MISRSDVDNDARNGASDHAEPAAAYPEPPWRLRGDAFQLMTPIPIATARGFVPPEFKIVPFLPGRTLGGLYVARYAAGSTLTYSELLVVPGFVRYGRRWGIWVSHIYVDDASSMAGGREIWGLPKELAEFRWDDAPGTVDVSRNGRLLCSLTHGRVRPIVRLPFPIPAISVRGSEILAFRSSARAGIGVTRATWSVPPDSPFSALCKRWRGLTVTQTAMDTCVPKPVSIGLRR